MPRQTSLQLSEATEQQAAALRIYGKTFTDIVRIAIDRLYREEIVTNKRPILYTCISDRWGNEKLDTTLEDFRGMCQEVFGQVPELYEHLQGGYWMVSDDDNEVILTTAPERKGGRPRKEPKAE